MEVTPRSSETGFLCEPAIGLYIAYTPSIFLTAVATTGRRWILVMYMEIANNRIGLVGLDEVKTVKRRGIFGTKCSRFNTV